MKVRPHGLVFGTKVRPHGPMSSPPRPDHNRTSACNDMLFLCFAVPFNIDPLRGLSKRYFSKNSTPLTRRRSHFVSRKAGRQSHRPQPSETSITPGPIEVGAKPGLRAGQPEGATPRYVRIREMKIERRTSLSLSRPSRTTC